MHNPGHRNHRAPLWHASGDRVVTHCLIALNTLPASPPPIVGHSDRDS